MLAAIHLLAEEREENMKKKNVIVYMELDDAEKELEIISYCNKNNYKILQIIYGIGSSKGIESFDLGIFDLCNYIMSLHASKKTFLDCNVIAYDLEEFSFIVEDQSAVCNMLFSLGCEVETLKDGIWGIDFDFNTTFKKL